MYRKMGPKEIEKLVKQMEEMAGAPKEEMGKRTPGERCMYETHVNGGPPPLVDRP